MLSQRMRSPSQPDWTAKGQKLHSNSAGTKQYLISVDSVGMQRVLQMEGHDFGVGSCKPLPPSRLQ